MTSSGITEAPDLSVVIAAWPDLRGLSACLRSVDAQCGASCEILVASAHVPTEPMRAEFPRVRWLPAAEAMLIPHLWALGIKNARGKIVALTTAHFVPAPDWCEEICAAHERLAAPGIGGAIDPPRGGSASDWATYFLRYSSYLNFTREQTAPDIAGDNASYKRAALAAHPRAIADGFWEQEFHLLIHAEGETLAFVPAIRVTQKTSFGVAKFCRQRIQHGRKFGAARVRGRGVVVRLARIASVPLIPAVLLAKVTWRVLASGRDLGPFLFSLPVLLVFILAWTAGEFLGYAST